MHEMMMGQWQCLGGLGGYTGRMFRVREFLERRDVREVDMRTASTGSLYLLCDRTDRLATQIQGLGVYRWICSWCRRAVQTAARVVYDPIGLEAGLDLFRKPTVTPSPRSRAGLR